MRNMWTIQDGHPAEATLDVQVRLGLCPILKHDMRHVANSSLVSDPSSKK